MALMVGNTAPTNLNNERNNAMDNIRITLLLDTARKWQPDPSRQEDQGKSPFVSLRAVTQAESQTVATGRAVPMATLVSVNVEPSVWKGLREAGLGLFDPADVEVRVLSEGKPYQRRDGTTAVPIRATPIWSTVRHEENSLKTALTPYEELPVMRSTPATQAASTPVAPPPAAPTTPVAPPPAPAQQP